MENLLTQLINTSSESVGISSTTSIVLNLLLAMILGVVIALVYKHVHKGISYSASYAFSIVLVTMVVAFVMMVIGSNVARAFTLLGAFTLIRFRTAVKDPKDTAFIFLALVVGLAVGATNYAMATAGTLVIGSTALVLNRLNFGSLMKLEQVLYMTIDAHIMHQKHLEIMLKGLFKEVSLININYNSANKTLQYSYNVTMKKKNDQDSAMRKITSLEGVKTAELLSSQQVIEF